MGSTTILLLLLAVRAKCLTLATNKNEGGSKKSSGDWTSTQESSGDLTSSQIHDVYKRTVELGRHLAKEADVVQGTKFICMYLQEGDLLYYAMDHRHPDTFVMERPCPLPAPSDYSMCPAKLMFVRYPEDIKKPATHSKLLLQMKQGRLLWYKSEKETAGKWEIGSKELADELELKEHLSRKNYKDLIDALDKLRKEGVSIDTKYLPLPSNGDLTSQIRAIYKKTVELGRHLAKEADEVVRADDEGWVSHHGWISHHDRYICMFFKNDRLEGRELILSSRELILSEQIKRKKRYEKHYVTKDIISDVSKWPIAYIPREDFTSRGTKIKSLKDVEYSILSNDLRFLDLKDYYACQAKLIFSRVPKDPWKPATHSKLLLQMEQGEPVWYNSAKETGGKWKIGSKELAGKLGRTNENDYALLKDFECLLDALPEEGDDTDTKYLPLPTREAIANEPRAITTHSPKTKGAAAKLLKRFKLV